MVQDGSAVHVMLYYRPPNGDKTSDGINIYGGPNVRTKGKGSNVCGGNLNEKQTALRYMVTGSVTVRKKVYAYVW